jgi:hypothetical protein
VVRLSPLFGGEAWRQFDVGGMREVDNSGVVEGVGEFSLYCV